MSTSTVARRGRPRDAGLDEAILDATLHELVEHGLTGLTIEAVAERAGVARTTVYRRWPDTVELALAAIRQIKHPPSPAPTGSVRDQLVALVDALRRTWNNPRYAAIMRRVAAEGTAHPQLYHECRDRLVGPQVARFEAVLARGVAEGVVRDDVELGWVRRLLTGPVIAAALTMQRPVTRAQVEASVDLVLRGVRP